MLESCYQNAISDRVALCPSSSRLASVHVPIHVHVLPLVPAAGCCNAKACAPISAVIPTFPSAGSKEETLWTMISGLKKCSDLFNCAALKKRSLSPAMVVIHLSALHPSHGGIMTGALIWLQEKLKIGLGLTPTTDHSRAMKGLLI